jgi:hypothetical protein
MLGTLGTEDALVGRLGIVFSTAKITLPSVENPLIAPGVRKLTEVISQFRKIRIRLSSLTGHDLPVWTYPPTPVKVRSIFRSPIFLREQDSSWLELGEPSPSSIVQSRSMM